MGDAAPIVRIEARRQSDNEVAELTLKYDTAGVHGSQTLKCLDAMRKERQLCDVILTVEGHELFAHRALLSCHSNYFFELFLTDENETSTKKQLYYQIDDLEHAALKLIIQFIYRGRFVRPRAGSRRVRLCLAFCSRQRWYQRSTWLRTSCVSKRSSRRARTISANKSPSTTV